MKSIKIFTVVFLITGLLFAQEILWQRIFDTGETDYARGITTDSEGNIIVTGISAFQNSDGSCLTIKYNQNGDTVWTRWYDVNARGVTTDNSGNIIIGGDKVIKCDPSGDVLWSQTYATQVLRGYIGRLAVDSNNNIIVVGTADYNLGDYITLKYDTDGNLLWMRTYDGGWEDCGLDVAVDESDNIIVTGYSDSDINWDWCTIKYSPEGDTLWIRRYDVAITDWAFGVTTDKEGNVIVAGETHQLLPGTGGCSAMVVKYSAQGDTLWTKIFTDTLQYAEVVSFADVVTDDYGNIYLAGEFAQWNDRGQLWRDYYIAKCTSLGDTVWTKRCSYGGRNEVSGIALDQWGNIIVTGSTYPGPEESLQRDYFTVKLQNTVSSIEEYPSVSNSFDLYQNYPNPFNASTTVRYEIPEAAWVTITLYDLLGCKLKVFVSEYKQPGAYDIAWDAANYSSGVYFVQMTSGNNFTITRKMLLMK